MELPPTAAIAAFRAAIGRSSYSESVGIRIDCHGFCAERLQGNGAESVEILQFCLKVIVIHERCRRGRDHLSRSWLLPRQLKQPRNFHATRNRN
jgi:hypothetical protein